MKVLWFVHVPFPPVDRALPPGPAFAGTGWWMPSLLEGIRTVGGVDVHVAWGHDGAHHEVARVHETLTVEVFPLWRCSSPRQGGAVRQRVRAAVSLLTGSYPIGVDGVIDRVSPDVIHIHGTESAYGLLLQKWGVPAVVSIQGSPRVWSKRYWGSHGLWTRIRHPRNVMAQMLLAAGGRREARILRHATAVAGRTRWDERFCRTAAKQAVYYRCFESVRPEFLSAQRADRASDREQEVVVVSSAQPYKGVELAIAAVVRLRLSGRKVRLIVAGGYPTKGWGPEVRRAAAAAGPEAVEMTGYLSAAEIAARLARADAYILPSYIENSSNSLLEAMAAGVPCVAARVGGVPSLMRDRHEGLLFRRGDVLDLEKKLDRLLADGGYASRLGHAAARRARATCRPEDVARSTIKLYEKLAQA